jgi:hypothetical protein
LVCPTATAITTVVVKRVAADPTVLELTAIGSRASVIRRVANQNAVRKNGSGRFTENPATAQF